MKRNESNFWYWQRKRIIEIVINHLECLCIDRFIGCSFRPYYSGTPIKQIWRGLEKNLLYRKFVLRKNFSFFIIFYSFFDKNMYMCIRLRLRINVQCTGMKNIINMILQYILSIFILTERLKRFQISCWVCFMQTVS